MITIAWDVDDVLNDFMRNWLEDFWRKTSKEQACSYEDILKNPPHEILGITSHEYLNSIDLFRLSDKAFYLKPNQEILCWFQEKGELFRHIALTATPLQSSPFSAYWVTKNFGKWIQSYNFVPSKRDGANHPVYYRNKKEFLSWIQKIDILVDDNEDNIKGAESVGVKGILVSRPWNTDGYSISEALNLLDKLSENKLEAIKND